MAGAGPAGLFAAKTLLERGARVTVVESEDRPGGLAASDDVDGNVYEGGVHHLHAHDALVFGEISSMLGDRLIATEKSARIRFGDGFRPYPLQFGDLLRAMPPWTLLSCSGGLAFEQLRGALRGTGAPANGEEALKRLYGAPLYREFFRDFTHQYWGVHPRELSATFIQKKMPRLSAFEGLRKALGRVVRHRGMRVEVEHATVRETLYYTAGGAHEIFDELAAKILRLGGEIRYGAPLRQARLDGGAVASVVAGDGEIGGVDALLSTVPLPMLIESIDPPAPEQARLAASRLEWKPLTVLGLLVRRERVLDSLYVYFRGRSFHRVGEPKNSGLRVTPEGHTILIIELTRAIDVSNAAQRETALGQAVEDLVRDGILTGGEEIAGHHFLHRPHAYPVFRRGFEEHLACVERYLATIPNLVSTGRQGSFAYPNMHQAMRMGHEAAVRVLGG